MSTRTITLPPELLDAAPGVLHRMALMTDGEDAAVLRLLSDLIERAAAGNEPSVEAIAVNTFTTGED